MDYPESERGKCITCGFFAKVVPPSGDDPSPRYYEVPLNERPSNALINLIHVYRPGRATGGLSVPTRIACFRHVVDFSELLKATDWNNEIAVQVTIRAALDEVPSCKKWYGHEPGRTPQEHLADYMAAELEAKRKAFELELFGLSQKLQSDSLRTARYNFWATVILGVIVIVLTIMQVRLASKPTNVIIQMPEQQHVEPTSR